MLSRILNGVITGMAVLAGLILLFIALSISYGMTLRAFGLQSPVWTVQFNEYSLLWMTFLGSAWVLGRRKHVAIDIVTGRFTPRAKRITEIIHSLMGIGLCGVLCLYSFFMVHNLWQRGVTDVQAVDVPKSLVVFVIPFGFLILTVQFLRNLVEALSEKEKDQTTGNNEADTAKRANAPGGN